MPGSFHWLYLLPFTGLVVGKVSDDADKLRFFFKLYGGQRFQGIRQQGKILMVEIIFPSASGSDVVASKS